MTVRARVDAITGSLGPDLEWDERERGLLELAARQADDLDRLEADIAERGITVEPTQPGGRRGSTGPRRPRPDSRPGRDPRLNCAGLGAWSQGRRSSVGGLIRRAGWAEGGGCSIRHAIPTSGWARTTGIPGASGRSSTPATRSDSGVGGFAASSPSAGSDGCREGRSRSSRFVPRGRTVADA